MTRALHHRSLFAAAALVLSTASSFAAPAPPDEATAACMRRLKTIGQALKSYQQARGDLPAYLSVLTPRYLRDKGTLHCPADPSPGDLGAQAGRVPSDPNMPVSYLYEMNAQVAVFNLHFAPKPDGKLTWRQQKRAQRVYFGDRVPVVRCWHHTQVPAGQTPFVPGLALSGKVFRTVTDWEYDPQTVPVLLASLERDLAAGPATFRRRWSLGEIAAYFSSVPPMPALRARLRAAAKRLAAMPGPFPKTPAGGRAAAVASLYRAAGDTVQAEAAYPTFHPNPPDGTTYLVRLRTTRTMSLGPHAKHPLAHEVCQRVRVTRMAGGFAFAGPISIMKCGPGRAGSIISR
jgi:hypothetical protein